MKKVVKIILVATNARGKNFVFVTDTLQVYSLPEALLLAKEGGLENAYPVNGNAGAYLRTKPNTPRKEQLDRLTISSHQLFSSLDDIKNVLTRQAFSTYWQLYQDSLEKDKPFIVADEHPRITKDAVKAKLQPHRDFIFAAAKKFRIDAYLLGAIIIDTARGLIKSGYYNPNPDDPKLSKEKIGKTPRSYLYEYVVRPEHNIFLAAATMRSLIDTWRKSIDISMSPEIIATLYSLKDRTPHPHPQPNDRGLQIANEFYKLAQEWLR